MTVRQAFAAAGYPVPDGAHIYGSGIFASGLDWDWRYWDEAESRLDYTFMEGEREWYWLRDDNEPSAGSLSEPNIANLPAIDVYYALPEVVRKVVNHE